MSSQALQSWLADDPVNSDYALGVPNHTTCDLLLELSSLSLCLKRHTLQDSRKFEFGVVFCFPGGWISKCESVSTCQWVCNTVSGVPTYFGILYSFSWVRRVPSYHGASRGGTARVLINLCGIDVDCSSKQKSWKKQYHHHTTCYNTNSLSPVFTKHHTNV